MNTGALAVHQRILATVSYVRPMVDLPIGEEEFQAAAKLVESLTAENRLAEATEVAPKS